MPGAADALVLIFISSSPGRRTTLWLCAGKERLQLQLFQNPKIDPMTEIVGMIDVVTQ